MACNPFAKLTFHMLSKICYKTCDHVCYPIRELISRGSSTPTWFLWVGVVTNSPWDWYLVALKTMGRGNFIACAYQEPYIARVVKVLSILCRGHGVEPRGGHNFVLDLLANPVLPRGGLGLVHLMPSRRPVNRQVTARIAMSPSVRPVSSMPSRIRTSMCHLVIGMYCHVSPCQWCHVAPPFYQISLFHQYNRTR